MLGHPSPLNLCSNDETVNEYVEVYMSPERSLLLAMVTRAVMDYNLFWSSPRPSKETREIARRAKEWVYSPKTTEYSFLWICEQLRFSHTIRKRVREYMQGNVGSTRCRADSPCIPPRIEPRQMSRVAIAGTQYKKAAQLTQ